MRLIDADNLKTEFHAANNRWWNQKMAEHEYDIMLFIDSMPTINTEPVRHGHWEIKKVWSPTLPPIERPFCSLCGGQGSISYQYGYCPYCGARMDEVKDDG